MAIRAGRGEELASLGEIYRIFLPSVSRPIRLLANPRIAKATGVNAAAAPQEVSLLAVLVDHEAPHSLARSPLLDQEVVDSLDSADASFVTDNLAKDCKLLWYVTEDVYSDLASAGENFARDWAMAESQWKWLKGNNAKRKVPADLRVNSKNKLKLIKIVTAPQLQCVGIPMRRREIEKLQEAWLAALAKAREANHERPSEHPAVKPLASAYFEASVGFVALCLALDDGMRRKQYMHGRAGTAGNFVFDLLLDEESGEPVGVKGLKTRWSGDRRDPACLKVRAVGGRMAEREREVAFGLVDRTILFDVLRYHRAQQLAVAGVVEDEGRFDLAADLKSGQYALFVSGRSGAKELSMSQLGSIIGKELHYIVRKWLRPEIPEWEALDLGWRCLWSIHILRLLIASYWGGVRGRWALAEFLTMDVERTLRANYVEIDRGLSEREKLKPSDWEHPNAYDAWMDRIRGREVIDPILDPDLPLPPGIVDEVALIRSTQATGRSRGRDRRSSARIRRARPGQRQPGRHEESEK